MRLGFFTNAFRFFPLDYTLKSISDHGYEGINLWAKGDHVTPFDGEKKWLAIKEEIESYGLEIYAVSAHLDFVSPDAEKRKREYKKFMGVLDLAYALGIDQVQTASGGLYEDFSFEKQGEYFVSMMNEFGKVAEDRGIIIGLEPEPEKWMSTPKQTIDLIKTLRYPVFKAVVDMGHAFGVNETPESYIQQFKDYLLNVHVDDVNKGDFPHRHLIPGEGDVDFVEAFKMLREVGYKDWLTVELNKHNEDPDTAARLAMEYMSKFEEYWK
ncbi:MAG: sugar phosphate isomerase/epimerase [Candidatus Hydrothermarchaeales archaeon]